AKTKTTWNLTYREVANKKLKADVFQPVGDGPFPSVLMVHGGAWAAGSKWDVIMHGRALARAGYVVLSINYRLAPKFKMAAQVDDVRFAARWMVDNAEEWKIDTSRIAFWGYSAGGHLVSQVALQSEPEDPSLRAVVAGGAPCDFNFIPMRSKALNFVLEGTRESNPKNYERFTPLNYARKDAPPFFFFHGDKDLLVPQQSSKSLYEKLKELEVQVDYYSVANKGHMMTFLDSKAQGQVIAFLDSQLKDNKDSGKNGATSKTPNSSSEGS
ncbi:MAG: alpha/beta hydrolase, partial [Planctomycetota bacterium]